MATALDVIKRSLRMLGEIAAETGEAPNDAQATQALDTLNAMLAGWEHEGVQLGIPTLTLTSTIPVPATHDDAIAFNLAFHLGADFGIDPPQAVAMKAASTFASLQTVYAHTPQMVAAMEYIAAGRVRW